jgi:hypothetical protein
MKVPTSKLQLPKKSQAPSSNGRTREIVGVHALACLQPNTLKREHQPLLELGIWNLFGTWNLELGT